MTDQEILDQAKAEIAKKEREVLNVAALEKTITAGTTQQVNAKRTEELRQLREEAEAYQKVYKRESVEIADKIKRIENIEQVEEVDKKSLDGVIGAIEFSNKVDDTRASFTEETGLYCFDRGVRVVGKEKFMSALENAGGNVYQALADIYGCKNIFELTAIDEKAKEDAEYLLSGKKDDREFISRLAKEVAKQLKNNHPGGLPN